MSGADLRFWACLLLYSGAVWWHSIPGAVAAFLIWTLAAYHAARGRQ